MRYSLNFDKIRFQDHFIDLNLLLSNQFKKYIDLNLQI